MVGCVLLTTHCKSSTQLNVRWVSRINSEITNEKFFCQSQVLRVEIKLFLKRKNFSRPFSNFLLSFFQQPDVVADSGTQGQPDAVPVPIGEGGGQFDAVAVVGPIGPELFGAAPFTGQKSFSILVSGCLKDTLRWDPWDPTMDFLLGSSGLTVKKF